VTTYTVQVTDEQGCNAAATAEVTVSPGLSVSLVQAGDSLLATAGAATYSWYRNDTLLASGTDPFYLPVVNGDYHVIATDSLGCEAISADFNFILTSVIGQSSAGSIRVYPNPAEQTVTIDLGQSSGGFSLRVLDMTGRVCLQVMQEGSKAEVDLRGLVTGTYSVEIVAGGMHAVKRLLVAR
ncbi:MAG TPA: T9SS type A sorting domain-containing protein, partial [Bacteroidia bacterium]|nr:T9SS type A sorting domain-containing protein [Bacteroidia bacterium]